MPIDVVFDSPIVSQIIWPISKRESRLPTEKLERCWGHSWTSRRLSIIGEYSGTRLESKLVVFFGFSVCSHVYLLNYRSELAQIWRQDTDTIHNHNHTKKIFQCKCGPQ